MGSNKGSWWAGANLINKANICTVQWCHKLLGLCDDTTASLGVDPDPLMHAACLQVEFLTRVMRVWDEDHEPDEHAMDFGEFILKV